MPSSRFGFPRTPVLEWNRKDGWSPTGFIIAPLFKNDVLIRWSDLAKVNTHGNWLDKDEKELKRKYGFASHMNIGRSLSVDSPTVLIDCETGELIAHWVDLPEHEIRDEYLNDFRTLIIQPAQRLKNSRRYIVVVKNIVQTNLVKLKPPLGFNAIVRDQMTDDPHINARIDHFRQKRIFEIIFKSTGFHRLELYLAWDFTTSSLVTGTEPIRYMRDHSYELYNNTNIEYNIDKVTDDYNKYIFRKVEGTFRVPLFLQTARTSRDSKFTWNLYPNNYAESLQPLLNGWTDVPFVLWIPKSVVKKNAKGDLCGNREGSILQYGHGMFRNRYEAETEFLLRIAYEEKYIISSIDWWGLSDSDLITFAQIILMDLADIQVIAHRSAQAILNQLTFTKFLKYGNAIKDDKVFSIGGKSVLKLNNKNDVYNLIFYGISLGGIMGTAFNALSDEIQAAAFSVPGGPFSLLFPRNPIGGFVFSKIYDTLFLSGSEKAKALLLMQQLWEVSDPTTFSVALSDGGYFGESPGKINNYLKNGSGKKISLYQISPGDGLVNNIASFYLLRSLKGTVAMWDPYETRYMLNEGNYYVRIFPDGKRYFFNKDLSLTDRVSLLPVSNPSGRNLTWNQGKNFLFSFHFQANAQRISFYSKPLSLWDLYKCDTHELTRLSVVAQQQLIQFFNVYRQRTSRKPRTTRPPCEYGCWNMKRPDKKQLRKPNK